MCEKPTQIEIMGWFSADEIVAPVAVGTANEHQNTAQTVSLCVLAAAAVAYIATKLLIKLHRQHIERVAARTVRLNNVSTM